MSAELNTRPAYNNAPADLPTSEPVLRVPVSVARRFEREHAALSAECERLGDELSVLREGASNGLELRGLVLKLWPVFDPERLLDAAKHDAVAFVLTQAVERLTGKSLGRPWSREPAADAPKQVDLEEAIARAKAAAPAKPKRTRAKKAPAPVPSTVSGGITVDPAGNVWTAEEARRRDEIDPDWMPEPEWSPDGGRLRYLEECEASGHAAPGGPDSIALADIRSGKRCALCGRRAWRSEHTRGCPNEAPTMPTKEHL